jgi:hypothetical protein
MKTTSVHTAGSLAGLLAACFALPASGQQADALGVTYALRAGANLSDNINRVPDRFAVSAAGAMVGLELQGSRPVGRLRYDLAANVSRYEFLDLDLQGQTFGRAAANAAFDFVPDVLWMNGRVSYDQVREDILRPIAIGNLIDQVTTSFGPTLRWGISSVVDSEIDLLYTRNDFSGFFPDSETVGGRAQLLRQASPVSMLAIGVSYDDTSYDQTPIFDFNRKEAFVRFESTLSRTEIEAEIGYAQVDGIGIDQGGALMRTRVSRRVAPTLRAYAAFTREYPTAQGTAFAPVPGTPGPGGLFDASILTAAPRLSTVGQVGLLYQRTRTRADLSYARREEEALILGIGGRSYNEYQLNLRRELTPRSRASVFGILTSDAFPRLALSVDEFVFGGEFAFDIGRSLGVDFRAEHRVRDGNFAGEFTETSAGIYLRYFGRSARGAARR